MVESNQNQDSNLGSRLQQDLKNDLIAGLLVVIPLARNAIHNKDMKNNLQYKKEISKKLKEKAIFEGFTIAGIASLPGSSRIKLRTNALERWLSNNHHAEMKWMEAERRKNINTLLKDAKSILSVGFTYLSSHDNNNRLKIGKFSQGEDYHKVIYKKLKNVGKWINLEIPDC